MNDAPSLAGVASSQCALEDHAELHAAAPHMAALRVPPLTPPPEAIAKPSCDELKDLDRVAGELDLHRPEAQFSRGLDDRLCLVAPQMTEAAVVTPVGAAKDGRDISEGMRHRHPGSTPGFEHTGQLTQGFPIVRD